ncbi:unnamed protein product [Linum trigynum]|uniref:Uncharacterized protein n=1 Tax=Linum trigynum TaxID=586398 RepID=A0AAV2E584_9ROSI
MAGLNPHVPLHLAQASIFTGRGFNRPEDYNRYLVKFQDRPLCPSVYLDLARFNRYDMNIPRLINVVGGLICLSISAMAFVLKQFEFDLLSYLLGYPIQGAEVVDEADFPTVEFNENEAMHLYARDIGAYHPARLDARCLPDDLKVLHFYITRVFLPRSHGLTRIYPMDMWILARAKENRHISYPHLMIGHMMQYCDDYFYDELPFAPQITLLMRSLDLDMRYKVARVNLIDSLWDQFVLRKVNALVGLSLADLVEGIPEEEEAEEAMSDISDYLSSPTYPF